MATEVTVDELAQLTKVPVRTIREYQTMRLLPPPRRQGRVGLYGPAHVERMRAIARLSGRGYSLAAIRDLFEARHAGADLGSLLGGDADSLALDETPLRLTTGELHARLPGLTAAQLRRAREAGLFHPDGREHVLVRSPALLALVTEAVSAGAAPTPVLEVLGELRDGLDALTTAMARPLIAGVLEPLQQSCEPEVFAAVLRRARLLLLQGVASVFADRLGNAISTHATSEGTVRAAVDAVRVGVITDAAGNLRSSR